MTPTEAQDRPTFGPFAATQRLAAGGGGTVWLAERPGSGRADVVVKHAEPGRAAELRSEWQVLFDVPCPLLPEPLTWLPAAGADGTPALAMARREGLPLDQAWPSLTWPEAWQAVAGALRGLRTMHAAGWVHGDLHPGNLLIAKDAAGVRVALLDLGLAQPPGTPVRGPGRLAFAAPDRLRGGLADPRDDLFSLGLSLWHAWGLPTPWPDWPALLPGRDDRPQPPVAPGDPRLPALRLVAGWLAPAREHRPDHAEQALRAWQALDPQGAQAPDHVLADDLDALASRAWRWGRWGEPPVPTPAAGTVLWVVGPAGSGRGGVLRALAESVEPRGGTAVWIRACEPGRSPLDEAWQVLAWRQPTTAPARPVAGEALQVSGPLGDPAAVAAAAWHDEVTALRQALGVGGMLLVDDVDELPAALQRALTQAGPQHQAAALVLAAREAEPRRDVQVWAVPDPRPAEVAAALRAASGERTWDAGLAAGLAAAVGPERRAILPLAATLLRRQALVVAPDRVEWNPASGDLDQMVRSLSAERRQPVMPPAEWLRVAAHLAWARACRPGTPGEPLGVEVLAAARATRLVRTAPGGGLAVADEAARAFLLGHLPARVLADAARERAAALLQHLGSTEDTDLGIEFLVLAAQRDGGQRPGALAVQAVAERLLKRGEAARATGLAAAWLDRDEAPGGEGLAAVLLRGLVALGRWAEAEAHLTRWSASWRDGLAVRLARAELAFRRGDYPTCRALAEEAVAAEPSSAEARVWQGFSATWQGDRDAARAAIAAGRALQDPSAGPALDYLAALTDYYEGRLDEAEPAFVRLRATALGSLRAAAAGGLGLVAHRRGDLVAARAAYDEARQLAEAAGDRPRALNMAMNAAVLDHEAGDLGRALQGYDRVVEAARRLGDAGALSRGLNNRGNLLALLGCDERAAEDLHAALAALQRTGNAYLEGNVRCVLAELLRRGGQLQAAADQLARAEQGLREAGAESELSEIRLEHGYLRLSRGEVEGARTLAAEVLAAAERLESRELQARALGLRALVVLDGAPDSPLPPADELRQAAADLERALTLAPAEKPLLIAQLAAERGRALAWLGDLTGARTLAREQLACLDRIATTLPGPERTGFQRATAHARTRDTLRLLAGLGEPSRGLQLGQGALHAVLAINRRLSGEHDLPQLLEIMMDSAVLLTGAERGFLLLDDDDDGDDAPRRERRQVALRVAVARNLDRENLRKPAHKLSHTIAMQVFDRGEPVLATDAQADDRFAEQASVHTGSLRSILCVPLRWQGRCIGVLYVDNRFAAGAFSADHASVLEALADQAAIAIQTARVIARQRRTAEALQQSRAEVEQLNAQLRQQLAEAETALVDARADLDAQRMALARRSDFQQIKGESPQLHRLFSLMERVRDHDFPVLIRGESGTGKELVARAIHFTGRRRRGPFVAVNCGALPSNLLESELFGHARGAFTGAVAERRGLFESAHGGTLLLDEIGEMPLEMQVKLLRVLQTGEIQRVGDSTLRKVDARVVTATHRDLKAMVAQGTFREDLWYRLGVVELEVPPLRLRTVDIPLLVEHFLAENRSAGVGKVAHVSRAAMARLRQHPWPGNVRQLEMVLKSACLFALSDTLDVADLEPLLGRDMATTGEATAPHAGGEDWLATGTLDQIEARLLQQRMKALGGNKRKVAESLGIDRSTLYNRIKALGLEPT